MTTIRADIMRNMKTFFEAHKLQQEDVCGVCTNRAPAMLGSQSDFTKKEKELALEQWSQKYGPRVGCGPQGDFIRLT